MSKVKENKSIKGKTKVKTKIKTENKFKYNKIDSNYTCNECQYKSDCFGRLAAHMTVHSERRPFVCNYTNCEQRFKRKNSMERHYKTLHLKERLFVCNICDKRFSQSDNLKQHLFCHSDSKSYNCPISGCHKQFRNPRYLQSHHKRRHSNIKTCSRSPDSKPRKKRNVVVIDVKPIEEKTTQEVVVNSMSEPIVELKSNTSVSTDANDSNDGSQEVFRCLVGTCGQTFHLQRSLRSHYKFSHSKQYNKSTKSLQIMANNDNNDSNSDTNSRKDSQLKANETIFDENYVYFDSNQALSDVQSVDKISNNSFVFQCNLCFYKTKSFETISDHFDIHWKQMSQ